MSILRRTNVTTRLTNEDDNPELSNNAHNKVYAYDGDDTLQGEGGNDTLYAGDGDDVLVSGGGDDYFYGGSGNDEYVYSEGSGKVVISETSGTDVVDVSNMGDVSFFKQGRNLLVVRNGEQVSFSAAEIARIHSYDASAAETDLVGDEGVELNVEEIFGSVLNLNDRAAGYVAGLAVSRLDHMVTIKNQYLSEKYVVENFVTNDGALTVSDIANLNIYDLGTLEHMYDGSQRTMRGTVTADRMAGSDDIGHYMYSYAGDDTLVGGAKADKMYGSTGNDQYHVTNGDIVKDTGLITDADEVVIADYNREVAYSRVSNNLVISYVNNADEASTVTIQNYFYNERYLVEAITLPGEGSHTSADVIANMGGVQRTSGSYLGDNIDYSAQTRSKSVHGNAGNDTITGGAGNDYLYGDAGDDILIGMNGNDYLYGGDGNDELIGALGSDKLYGGKGDDTYTAANGDVVKDTGLVTDDDVLHVTDYASDATFAKNGNHLVISYTNDADEASTITVQNYFYNEKYEVETINLGMTSYDRSDILDAVGSVQSTRGTYLNDHIDYSDSTTSRSVHGYTGDDLIEGGAGNDYLYGDEGEDTLLGGEGKDRLYGEEGDDTIMGGAGADTLYGGVGNDYYGVEAGDVVQDTGLVTDNSDQVHVMDYASDATFVRNGNHLEIGYTNRDDEASKVTIQNYFYNEKYEVEGIKLGDGEVMNRDAILAEVGAVQSTRGTYLNDNIDYSDTTTSRSIHGYAGDDLITGGAGNDYLYGDEGEDTLVGGAGNDRLYGEEGNDELIVGAGNDRAYGGEGDDTLVAESGNNLLDAGEGDDFVLSGSGNDTLVGGAGNDTLGNFEGGNDVIHDASGNDDYRFSGDFGHDTLADLAGDDVITLQGISSDEITVSVDAAGNFVITKDENNSLTVVGSTVEKVVLDDRVLLVNSDGTYVVQEIIGTEGNDDLVGTDSADTIRGLAGNDTIVGLDGNDLIEGGAGNDDIEGGVGNDTISVAGDFNSVAGGAGNDVITGGTGVDNLDGNADNDLIIGNAGHDAINGGAGDDTLIGGADNDILVGEEGNDSLDGGAGNDTLQATRGNSTMIGGEGNDSFVGAGFGGDDLVSDVSGNETYRFPIGGDAGDDTITDLAGVDVLDLGVSSNDVSIEKVGDDLVVTYTGPGLHNSTVTVTDCAIETLRFTDRDLAVTSEGVVSGTINGDGDANSISGSIYNDAINSGAGDDTISMSGNFGVDTITDTTGNDKVVFDVASTSAVIGDVDVNGDRTVTVGDNSVTIVDDSVETLSFTDGDVAYGSAENTNISGTVGNDTFYSGSEDNILNGGGGNDTYVISEAAFGNDAIVDAGGSDKIILEGLNFENVVFGRNGANLTISNGLNSIEIANNAVETIEFQNGDTISASIDADGSAGDDIIFVNGVAVDALAGNDTITGGVGNDDITGGSGNDDMDGDAGNNTYRFATNFGADTISGDDGTSTAVFDGINMADVTIEKVDDNLLVTETATGSTLQIDGNAVEALSFADKTISVKFDTTAAATNDYVIGNGGATAGGDGADTLLGTAGADDFDGGAGDDTYVIQGSSFASDEIVDASGTDKVVFENVNYSDVLSVASAAGDIAVVMTNGSSLAIRGNAIESIQFADGKTISAMIAADGDGNDNIIFGTDDGATTADDLNGGVGNDTIIAKDGNDTLTGGAGNDDLQGGTGNDVYSLGANFGNDTITDASGHNKVIFDAPYGPGSVISNQVLDGNRVIIMNDGSQLTVMGDTIRSFEFASGSIVYDTTGIEAVLGTVGNDQLISGDAANNMAGNAGDDFLFSGAGNDTLQGDSGNDTLMAESGDNDLQGGSDNDALYSGSGDDALQGGSGDDIYYLDSGFGNDTITDASGADRVILEMNYADATITEAGGNITITDGTDTLLINSNAVEVLQFADRTVSISIDANGTPNADFIFAAAGGSNVDGLDDNDTMVGGAGIDNLDGGAGDDSIEGGAQDDVLVGGAGDDTISGGTGDDYIDAADGENVIDGGAGNDTILSADDADSIIGGDDDDSITACGGNDTIDAGNGNNEIIMGAGDDSITSGTGADDFSIIDLDVAFGADTIQAGAGSDTITFSGYSYAEATIATDGTDVTVTVDDGDDAGTGDGSILIKGNNVETLAFDDKNISVKLAVNGEDGVNDYIFSGDVDDTLTGGTGDDTMIGSAANNDLRAGDGANIVLGEAGNDTISGGANDDLLYGGADNDSIAGAGGNDTIEGESGDDHLDGGAGDDSLIAGEGNDTLIGGVDDDTLIAGSGDNDLRGGAGNDSYVISGTDAFGADTITDTSGADTVTFSDINIEDVSINVSQGGSTVVTYRASTPDESTLTIESNTVEEIVFADGGKVLVGTAGADNGGATITGTANADFISGLGDNDSLVGGDGADTIDGGDENDTIIGGTGADSISGGSGSDSIAGGFGDDIINAQDGNDEFMYANGDGADTISGGDGVDQVIFSDLASTDVTVSVTSEGNVIVSEDADALDSVTIIGNDVETLSFTDKDIKVELGTAGNDSTDLSNGDNQVVFDAEGNDTYIYTSGDDLDTIVDASGTDEIVFADLNSDDVAINVNAGDRIFTNDNDVSDAVTVKGDNIETVTFADGNKIKYGQSADDALIAGTGNDTLFGNDGADTLFGQSGADSIEGGDGADSLVGDDGNDTMIGDAGNDTIEGNEGNDSIIGGAGDDALSGGVEDDEYVFAGNFGNDTVVDTSGVDKLSFSGIASTDVSGLTTLEDADGDGQFDDKVITYDNAGTINTVTVIDNTVETLAFSDGEVSFGTSGAEVLSGSGVNDVIYGGAGDDTIQGLAGDDTLTGDAGDDSLEGGADDDTYRFFAPGFGADAIDDAAGNDTAVFGGMNLADVSITTDGTDVTVTSIADGDDNVVIERNEVETLSFEDKDISVKLGASGSDGVNDLVFATQDDTLTGGSGDDTMIADGTGGSEQLSGGVGDDTYIVDASGAFDNDTISEAAAEGTDTVVVRGRDASEANISTNDGANAIIRFGGPDAIVIEDNANVETVLFDDKEVKIRLLDDGAIGSNDANDYIIGTNAGGDDVLSASLGDDTLRADGLGNDSYIVVGGNDVIMDANGVGDVQFVGVTLDDIVSNTVDADSVGDGVVTYETGPVDARVTNTVTIKGDNIDHLKFADGHIIYGEGPIASAGTDIIISDGTAQTLAGLAGNDTIIGNAGNDTLQAGDGDDSLDGGADADSLVGGAGNDTLIGGAGNDELEGGTNNDTYVFGAAFGDDTITSDTNGLDNAVMDGFDISDIQGIQTTDGANSVIDMGGGNQLTINDNSNIEKITFDDGEVKIRLIDDAVNGADDVNDYIIGTNAGANDTLTAGTGNDTLVGGAGDDVYQVSGGDDVIIDSDSNGSIKFVGVSKDDIVSYTVEADGAGNSVVIYETGPAEARVVNRVTIQGDNIDELVFTDGKIIFGETPTASTGDDSIVGDNAAHETLNGLAGNDTIKGYGGDDTIDGGAGDDSLYGGVGADSILGGDDNDYIFADTHNDELFGNAGDDTLNGGANDDTLNGGADNDTYEFVGNFGSDSIAAAGETGGDDVATFFTSAADASFAFDGTDITIDVDGAGPGTNTVTVEGDIVETYQFSDANVDVAIGTGGTDVVFGLQTSDVVFAEAGDDLVLTRDGADTLNGAAGDDTLVAGAGDDIVNGGDDNDLIIGGAGNDALNGGNHNDTYTFSGEFGTDTITDASGVSTLKFEGINYVDSSVSATSVTVRANSVDISAVSEIDKMVFADTEVVFGTAGNDVMYRTSQDDVVIGLAGDDTIITAEGNDSVSVSAGNNLIMAGEGNDTITGGVGDDTLDGGAGNDAYSIADATHSTDIIDSAGNDTIAISEAKDYADGEFAIYKGQNSADDLIIGTGWNGVSYDNVVTIKDYDAAGDDIITIDFNGDANDVELSTAEINSVIADISAYEVANGAIADIDAMNGIMVGDNAIEDRVDLVMGAAPMV